MDLEKSHERPGRTYQLKEFVKRFLAKLGYEVRRHPPIPQVYNDAVTAVYHGLRGERAAVNAHLDNCVVPFGFSFGQAGWHPYVLTLKEYQRGDATTYESSFLHSFSSRFKPENAAELMTGDPHTPAGLKDQPPHAFTMPWDPDTVEERKLKLTRAMSYENMVAGLPGLGIEGGVGAIGPLSPAKGRIEFQRLTDLLKSVRENGYRRSKERDGDVTGIVLQRNAETRIVLLTGHHRAAVCTALGYDRMPVRLASSVVVRDADAAHWPRVKDGTWAEEEALDYFHQLFDCVGKDRAELYELGALC